MTSDKIPRNPLKARILLALTAWPRARILFRLLSSLMGVEIAFMDYGSTRFPHFIGIVIHSTCVLGKDVTIYQNVTIAAHHRVSQAATIGDGVIIGAGAVLIGPVQVGNGARVGANAVVVEDVPDGATVVGVPARVVETRRFLAARGEDYPEERINS